jgi:hypothetical protein
MNPWIKKTCVLVGLPLVLILNVAFIERGQEIELQVDFNARATRDFTKQAGNIKFVMPTGTKLRVEEARKLNSGHYGLFVEVLSGKNQSQKVWVYYNTDNPRIKLNSPTPAPQVQGRTIQPVLGLDRPPAADAGNLDRFIGEVLRNRDAQKTSGTTKPQASQPALAVASVIQQTPKKSSPKVTDAPHPTTVADSSCSGSCGITRPQINIREAIQAVTVNAKANASIGARQTMAALYQSCSVLNKRPYDPFTDNDLSDYVNVLTHGEHRLRSIPKSKIAGLVRNHYYLKDIDYSNHQAPQCLDMRKTPPVFTYGARPSFSKDGREIDIMKTRRAGEAQVTGLDCSAFASVAMSTAGLKIRPSTRNAAENLFTSVELLKMNEKNSCMKRPTFTKGNTIQSGDIFSVNGHVFIIDRVGEDPFGVEALKKAGLFPKDPKECFGFPPPSDAFNFTLIQSAARGHSSAMIIEASRYVRPNRNSEGIVYNSFRDVFEAACLAEFGYQAPVRNRRGSALLRHRTEDPQCVFKENEKPILRALDCTGDCLKEALQ